MPFQSTRPMRGATKKCHPSTAFLMNFNPRAPCGARREVFSLVEAAGVISIHAPHAGRDNIGRGIFYALRFISIHAPHAGRDIKVDGAWSDAIPISIHAPHAGRDPFSK